MDEIEELRRRVDAVDERIVKAIGERAKICKAIGAAKKKRGMSVRDVARENHVYVLVKQKALEFDLNPLEIEVIYREIVNICSAVQE